MAESTGQSASIATLLRDAAARLAAAGIEHPAGEARLLLAAALGTTRAGLLRDRDRPADPARLEPLLARRLAREPLALILGRQGFWDLDLAVSPATLIPRADTETLIEAALHALPAREAVRRVLDLGTGTGALLLAALREFPLAWGVGVDLVASAAALAAANARAHGLAGRCAFLAGNWAAALQGRFDLVLCNPPYIPTGEIAALMPEVARHEPALALDGGADGLACYRGILAALPDLLAPQGLAVLELGFGQADDVTALARQQGLVVAGLRADLSSIPRALLLRAAPARSGLAKKPFGSGVYGG
jgi:release factor glutamine methyltransferase